MKYSKKRVQGWLYTSFFFALLFGSAFAVFSEYDFAANPDIRSYLGISELDFDQSPVRRYRIIIPFLASALSFIFGPVFDLIQPWHFEGAPFSLAFSYLLINTATMSVTFMLIFRAASTLGVSLIAAFLGCLCLVSSRWTGYFAGLPLVDSLYLLSIALMIYSFVAKNNTALAIALILGPWAKEAFVFFIPLCLYYGSLKRTKQIVLLTLTSLAFLLVRYWIDHMFTLDPMESYARDIEHFTQVSMSFRRLFSFHGIYELFSITGFWVLILFFLKRPTLKKVFSDMPKFSWAFIAIVIIHALLSTELARMFYIGGLLYVLLMSLVFHNLIEDRLPTLFSSKASINDKEERH